LSPIVDSQRGQCCSAMEHAWLIVCASAVFICVTLTGCGGGQDPVVCWSGNYTSSCDISVYEPIYKCPDASFPGKFSVIAVPAPCDEDDARQIYAMDSGWGGAHITLCDYQTLNKSRALDQFSKLSASLASAGSWRPHNFHAVGHDYSGWRAVGVKSKNLDHMVKKLKAVGFKPHHAGGWHVTVASMTGKAWKKGDMAYNRTTQLLKRVPWSVILIECIQREDGSVYFKHHAGLHLSEWHTAESALTV